MDEKITQRKVKAKLLEEIYKELNKEDIINIKIDTLVRAYVMLRSNP